MPNKSTPRYYPRLSELMPFDKIPYKLSFLKDGHKKIALKIVDNLPASGWPATI